MTNSLKNLTQFVYEDIRNKILMGDYPPDFQLVNRMIAKELGVSTIPVREAIQRHVSEGMLEHRHGDGFFVRRMDCADLTDIFAVRLAIEPLAAEKAARVSSPEQIDQMKAIIADWTPLVDELRKNDRQPISSGHIRQWVEMEERFHGRVAETSGNIWFANILGCNRVVAYAFYFHRIHPELINGDLASKMVDEHGKLVQMIEKKDSDAAREWMTEHITFERNHMIKCCMESKNVKLSA